MINANILKIFKVYAIIFSLIFTPMEGAFSKTESKDSYAVKVEKSEFTDELVGNILLLFTGISATLRLAQCKIPKPHIVKPVSFYIYNIAGIAYALYEFLIADRDEEVKAIIIDSEYEKGTYRQ